VDKNGWTFNPSVSAMFLEEQATNLVRGQGFRNNDQVLSRFVVNENQQGALDYFGFKGKYNPNAETPEYTDSNEYSGSINAAGEISYGNLAFTSYDNLKATYYKELYHYNKVKAGIPFSTQDAPDDYKVYPEEREGFIYQYKNKGLYPNTTKHSMSSISFYQNGIFGLDFSQYYLPKWWHFIYKIPRRW
jgi:hypothetical protein